MSASGSWFGWVARLVGVVGLVAAPVALVSGATASAVPNDSFTTAGATSWTVPGGVSCATFDVYGAQGGTGGTYRSQAGGAGGLGGEVNAYVPVLAGTVYDLNVGARGTDGAPGPSGSGGAGGAVGGGVGGSGGGGGGGGGGGMSSVSLSGTPLIIAAGGGGGGAAFDESHLGGAGGVDQSAGTDGATQGGQATAGGGATSSGGTAGANGGTNANGTEPTAGVATTGGTGGTNGDGGGGGGGGLYGGGGGGAGSESGGAGGGGGADLVPPAPGGVNHGVDAGNGGNGKILVSYTAGDTGCLLAPLTIEKTTTGVTPTPGQRFTVHVSCPGGHIDGGSFGEANGLSSLDLAFTADGSGVVQPSSGYTFGFVDPDTCTVTETVNGGATDTSYACNGSGASQQEAGAASDWGRVGAATASNPDDPCATSGPQSTPMTVDIVAPQQQATVTVTNTLVAPAPAPAPAQVIQPRFTG